MHEHEHRPGGNGHDLASWEERYRGAPALWSGRVNPPLVTEAGDLVPGRALDVGCGEGGDVLWLAGRGWQVTGLDWSQVALARAAEHATAAGLSERVTWVCGDVDSWQPPTGAFDLVTAHFLHPPADLLGEVVRRLGEAVAPGGTLLHVAHDPRDSEALHRDPALTRLMPPLERVVGLLDPAHWDVRVAEVQARQQVFQGEPVTLHDTVVRAVRVP